MSFRRGAALSTSTTLGYADAADVGPTEGNGFYRRWPDDLALLQEIGITDVRLTLDWARLQPKPGTLDPDWAERFEQMLAAAEAIGLRTWAALHDGSIPRWFDNDGGFRDVDNFVRWWPRWVERAADRFGDDVRGWVPFVEIPDGGDDQPWRDTWGILEGPHPVVAAVADPPVERLRGRMDLLGVVLDTDDAHPAGPTSFAQRWGTTIRDLAEQVAGTPLAVSAEPVADDAEGATETVGTVVDTVDDAAADGVAIELAVIDPAIAGADGIAVLLDSDRALTAAGERWVTA